MKIGRVKFAVKEIGYANASDAQVKLEASNSQNCERGHSANSIYDKPDDELFEEFEQIEQVIMDADGNDEDAEYKCRFCWMSVATPDNPLIKCCRCNGSVGSIHLHCLKQWLDQKRQSKVSQNFSSFYWKSFECEICKKAYPLMIKAGTAKFKLVEYEK